MCAVLSWGRRDDVDGCRIQFVNDVVQLSDVCCCMLLYAVVGVSEQVCV